MSQPTHITQPDNVTRAAQADQSPGAGQVSGQTDIASFQRASQAMKAAARGERLPLARRAKVLPDERMSAAKKPVKPFDAIAREAAVERAVSLLRTVTGYYAITVGELEDETLRLHSLSDERLRGTITAYEFASRHVGVILGDDKARDAAISQNATVAQFYSLHGTAEDELKQAAREAFLGKKSQPNRA